LELPTPFPFEYVIMSKAKDLLLAYAAAMPKEHHHYFTYIIASRSRTLYIGITNNLTERIREHREGTHDGFTKKYRIHRLVYFERFKYVVNAIAREKELKLWLREKKIALIIETNPTWEDLYVEIVTAANEKQVLRSAQDDIFKE
jgi:putative endonuclease